MEDIHDIRGPIEILPLWQELLPYFLCLLTLIALIALYLCYKKIRSKQQSSRIIPLTPYEIAMNELKLARKFIQPDMDKTLAAALSDIIKIYIQSTFAFQTSGKTSDEFLNNVKSNGLFEGESLESLGLFLEMCDLAKFAKRKFSSYDQESLYNKASIFLEIANQLHFKLSRAIKEPSNLCSE